MKYYEVIGQKKLDGKIEVENSKNAILPILAATTLTSEQVIIKKVPQFSDVLVAVEILKNLGKSVCFENNNLIISGEITSNVINKNLSNKLRASLFFVGAVLSKLGRVKFFEAGGCKLGERPINFHLKSFELLGATIIQEGETILINGQTMQTNTVNLPFPSVGATINTIFASVFLKGETLIINSAKEPEIVDLCNFLKKCGAKIYGVGGSVIKIVGVKNLHGCEHTPIPDRIVGGSYLLMVAATHGKVELCNFKASQNLSLLKKLLNCGCSYTKKCDTIYLKSPKKLLGCGNVIANVYPNFPTDLQPLITAFSLNLNKETTICDKVFLDRFAYVQELKNMGAKIETIKNKAVVKKSKLLGNKVFATDLRAGASLILAGLCAKGATQIYNTHFIERGYENIVLKLQNLGANICEKEE